jgi:hypothetical protein
MKMWLVAFVALAPLLAGCADTDTSDIAGIQIEHDSETCRAAAATGTDAHGISDGKTADEKSAIYARLYHDCMAASGYTVIASAP